MSSDEDEQDKTDTRDKTCSQKMSKLTDSDYTMTEKSLIAILEGDNSATADAETAAADYDTVNRTPLAASSPLEYSNNSSKSKRKDNDKDHQIKELEDKITRLQKTLVEANNKIQLLKKELSDVKKTTKRTKPVTKEEMDKQFKKLNTKVKQLEENLTGPPSLNRFGQNNAADGTNHFEEPIVDDDGTVTIFDRKIQWKYFEEAMLAKDMRKRLNAIFRGIWSTEERAMFTTETRNINIAPYIKIPAQDRPYTIKVCEYLQNHNRLKADGRFSIERLWSIWILSLLKSERHKNKEKETERSAGANKRKRLNSKDSSRNKESSADVISPYSDEETYDNPSSSSVSRNNKKPRVLPSLRKILQCLESNKYSVAQIKQITKMTTEETNEVLTSDTYVVDKGICKLVDLKVEYDELLQMIATISDWDADLIDKCCEKSCSRYEKENKDKAEIIKYLVYKYTVELAAEEKIFLNANEEYWRWDIVRICSLMTCYAAITKESYEWEIPELFKHLSQNAHVEVLKSVDWNRAVNVYFKKSYITRDNAKKTVLVRNNVPFKFGAEEILKRNYHRVFKSK